MALLSLVSKKQKAIIDTLELDASVTESHGIEVEVTDFPVEQGANVSDHRRVKPRILTIEGVVSNTPTPGDADAVVPVSSDGVNWSSRSSGDSTRASEALDKLAELATGSKLFDIVTGLTAYENMTLTSLSIPRNAQTGQALRFTATFREIRIVSNATVTLEAKTTRAKAKVDEHNKPTGADTEDKRTLALQLEEDGYSKTLNNFVGKLSGAKAGH